VLMIYRLVNEAVKAAGVVDGSAEGFATSTQINNSSPRSETEFYVGNRFLALCTIA
jgi:hypothetical protein